MTQSEEPALEKEIQETTETNDSELDAVMDYASIGASLVTSSTFKKSIDKTEKQVIKFSRALHKVERRTVILRVEPAPGTRKKELSPLPNPNTVDPWNVDRKKLKAETKVKSTCPTCEGKKKVACGYCEGTNRVPCGFCHGTGQVMGQRGWKNCPECRGRGQASCPECGRGKVECPTCEGAGRVSGWLTIKKERSEGVTTDAPKHVLEWFPEIPNLEHFSSKPANWPFELISDSQETVSSEDIPQELLPQIDPQKDRIKKTIIQDLQLATWDLQFRTLFGTGNARLASRPPRVFPGSNFKPFFARTVTAASIAVSVALIFLIGYTKFTANNEWFSQSWNSKYVYGFGLVGTITLFISFLGLFLISRARNAANTWIPLGVFCASIVGMAGAYELSKPTIADAETAFQDGNHRRALHISRSLLHFHRDVNAASKIIDRVSLHEFQNAETILEMSNLARENWQTKEASNKARRLFINASERELEKLSKTNKTKRLQDLLEDVAWLNDQKLNKTIKRAILLSEFNNCVEKRNYECVATSLKSMPKQGLNEDYSRLKLSLVDLFREDFKSAVKSSETKQSLFQKRAILIKASSASGYYRLYSGEDTVPPQKVISLKIKSLTKQIEKQERIEEARRKRESEQRRREAKRIEAQRKREAKRAEARRQRELKREQARRRRRTVRRVRCRDGTLSPSCICGGSLRGCCSHHGGVAGCY